MKESCRGTILVVGDDMRIFLAVARSLGRAGYAVHAAPFNWKAPALTSRYITKTHLLSRYSDDPDAWRAEIKAVLTQYDVDLIIPCCDRAILPLDLHRADFGRTVLALPSEQAMEILFDKVLTKELAKKLDIPVARGEQLTADQTATGLAGRYGLPIVIKPKRSYSIDRLTTWGRVHIAETLQELRTVLASIAEPELYLVEGYFEGGVGIGVSVLAREGKILQAFQHRRLREGWGGSSSYRISEDCDPALLEVAAKICSATHVHGVCMFEFRQNPANGAWILLEVNARLWGSLPLAVAAKVDFPRALCELLLGYPVCLPVAYSAGVRSRNAVLDGFNLLNATRKGRFESWTAAFAAWADYFAQPLWWITGRENTDGFNRNDLAPGFAELKEVVTRLAGSKSKKWNRRPGDTPVTATQNKSLEGVRW